jgi:hypothetical protein
VRRGAGFLLSPPAGREMLSSMERPGKQRGGRGRRTILVTGGLALSVGAAAAWTGRDWLLAPWHRHVLLAGDREASHAAAGRLAAIRSFDDIPLILQAFAVKDPYSEGNPYTEALSALVEIDPPRAVPLIARELLSSHSRLTLTAAFVLDAFCDFEDASGMPVSRFAIREAAACLYHPDQNVRGFCRRILLRNGIEPSSPGNAGR